MLLKADIESQRVAVAIGTMKSDGFVGVLYKKTYLASTVFFLRISSSIAFISSTSALAFLSAAAPAAAEAKSLYPSKSFFERLLPEHANQTSASQPLFFKGNGVEYTCSCVFLRLHSAVVHAVEISFFFVVVEAGAAVRRGAKRRNASSTK